MALGLGMAAVVGLALAVCTGSARAELPGTIQAVKPSVVAVGTYQATRRPPARVLGTGFVVADGGRVATNAHVLPDALNSADREFLAVFQRDGDRLRVMPVAREASDSAHDLALLRLQGESLPALALASGRDVREGEMFAFTGFPIGGVLGLRPVTHRGIVSSITPIAIPMDRSRQLDATMIKRLRDPYDVYQLDATAYPGNSGSPLFDPETGRVVGIVNSVFVKDTKEAVLEKPSGISYAIPVRYLRDLLRAR